LGSTLARLIMGAALALVIGVPLTRFLSEIFSWQTDFGFLIALMLFSLLYFMRFLPKAEVEEKEINFLEELRFFKLKDVQFVLLCMFLFFLGYGG
ncbi:MFS transporter, partial [Enterococcus faecium]|uniref:MFS transporter n=1 Tax=Enterococcus faecium TaxID=1352 RepID=UPI0034E93E49